MAARIHANKSQFHRPLFAPLVEPLVQKILEVFDAGVLGAVPHSQRGIKLRRTVTTGKFLEFVDDAIDTGIRQLAFVQDTYHHLVGHIVLLWQRQIFAGLIFFYGRNEILDGCVFVAVH